MVFAADLGLADRAGFLNINDDAELHVDGILVRISDDNGRLCFPDISFCAAAVRSPNLTKCAHTQHRFALRKLWTISTQIDAKYPVSEIRLE
jgi:hypothetical protein